MISLKFLSFSMIFLIFFLIPLSLFFFSYSGVSFESTSDLYSIEETSEFDGRYFVLNGLLSPIDNIGSEELRIEKLLDLIEEFNSKEVILALNSTLEGEATAYFLLEKLKKKDVIVTRIAQGVPAGGDLNYVDNNTLRRAIFYRTELK